MPFLKIVRDTVFKRTTAQSFSLSTKDKVSVHAGQSFEIDYAFQVGQHCFVKLQRSIGAIGKIGYFFLSHVEVKLTEVRGVWLTNVDSQILESRSRIQQGLQQLQALGFNTIYPVVWQRGFTLYPSPIAKDFIGSATVPDSHFANRDMLAEMIEEAQALNLRVIPWFEYGLATLPGSVLAKRHSQLLTLDRKGNFIRTKTTDGKPDHFVWLNPCHPEVQQFIVELINDVTTRYPIDGIQLDDHFGFPVELGYDSFTREVYGVENRGKAMPLEPKNADRIKWTTKKMTGLLTEIVKVIRANQPSCLISISPNPLDFSKTNYSVDWQNWVKQGLVDELVVQVYRDSLSSFINEISKREVNEVSNNIPTIIGILAGLSSKSVGTDKMLSQIKEVRKRKLSGISYFFYETLLNEQLSPTKVSRSSIELQRLFT